MAAKLPMHLQPSALALGVFVALNFSLTNANADSQYQCSIGANGQWLCISNEVQRTAPRPEPVSPSDTNKASGSQSSAWKEHKIATTEAAKAKGYALPNRSHNYIHLDWVPRELLSDEQLAEASPYCGGTYIEPARLGKDDNASFRDAPIYVNAVESTHDQLTQITTLTGDVIIRQASLQAESEQAQLDQIKSFGTLDGRVRLRDRDMLIVGDHAEIQLDTGEAQIDNAEYVIHSQRSRGAAEYIKRKEDGIIRLKSGSYTSCAPNNNHWHLQSNNITLNQETGFGHATNATLRVKNVPVFYTPYIYFPIDDRRQSGFLPPSISYSKKKGADVTTPYYFNLAPNYDATLYPNLITKRGLLTEAEFRHLGKKSEGQLGGAWLGNDKEKKRKRQSGYKEDRWMVNWQHQYGFNSRLLAEVDYTDISDPYYFQDLSSNIIESSDTTVDQKAGLRWRGDNFSAGVRVHAYERTNITDITPYNRMPQITVDGRAPGEWAGLQLSYSTELVRFERSLKSGKYSDQDGNLYPWRDTYLRGLNRAEGNRIHLEPQLSMPMEWMWGFVKPSLKFAYTKYDLELDREGKKHLANANRSFDRSSSRSIPIYSIDSGLYFDRPTQLFGKNYTQTLEPRLYYLYVPYKEQDNLPLFDTGASNFSYSSLWRDNRFSGKDRIGDTNQVSLGLTWRWLTDSGFERQRAAIGQARYFKDRRVLLNAKHKDDYKLDRRNTGSRSPYALQYMFRFNQDWKLDANYAWDPETHSPNSGSLMFNYQPADNLDKIINFGYRYRNDSVYFDEYEGRYVVGGRTYKNRATGKEYKDFYKVEQTDTSFMWPIFTRWNLIGRWQYDYNRNRSLEALGGVEYNNCCWKVRLVSRYWVDYDERTIDPEYNRRPDRGIFLQIILKGLGGVAGNKVSSFLDEGIPGYQKREDNAH